MAVTPEQNRWLEQSKNKVENTHQRPSTPAVGEAGRRQAVAPRALAFNIPA
jgi:hypothetical protein